MKPYYQDNSVTIYHGDCCDILPTIRADSIVTDPPYKLSQGYGTVDSDNLMAVVATVWAAPLMLSCVNDGASAAVFYDTRILPLALEAFRKGGWCYLRNLTLYRRWGNASVMHGWMSTSDFVLIFQKPGKKDEYYGPVFHDVFIKQSPENVNAVHPAQKPISFVSQIVQNITPIGGTVLDPFMGSGTTLRAAKDLGLQAIGIEIEEKYCEIAAERMRQQALSFEPDPTPTQLVMI